MSLINRAISIYLSLEVPKAAKVYRDALAAFEM
jgi:hypothetical protein